MKCFRNVTFKIWNVSETWHLKKVNLSETLFEHFTPCWCARSQFSILDLEAANSNNQANWEEVAYLSELQGKHFTSASLVIRKKVGHRSHCRGKYYTSASRFPRNTLPPSPQSKSTNIFEFKQLSQSGKSCPSYYL